MKQRGFIGLSSSSRIASRRIRHQGSRRSRACRETHPSTGSRISPLSSQLLQGFTLIELVVSVSIITLLIGGGIPAFRHFGRVQQLDQAADQVKGAILDTRAYALGPRSEKPSTVDWYKISFDQVAESYTLSEGSTAIGNATSLPPFIQIVSATNPIGYSVSGQGKVIKPGPPPVAFVSDPVIILRNSQLDATTIRTITVNRQTGAVNITR